MRVITTFFSSEELPIHPDLVLAMRETIVRRREWLGTNEAEQRGARFGEWDRGRRAAEKPTLRAFHFSLVVEEPKPSNPNLAA